MFKRSFWEVGQWLQVKAKDEGEANNCFHDSCNKCNKQAFCDESKCPIAKAHELKLLMLHSENSVGTVTYRQTRPYKKSSPRTNAKKAVLNFLTRISKQITNREHQVAIDDASVMVELGELESCYWVLRNAKLLITAEKVKSIIGGITGEVK